MFSYGRSDSLNLGQIRLNPLRLICILIQVLLEHTYQKSLDTLLHYTEQKKGNVAVSSPLSFIFVARDHYVEFKNHN